ncbi:MAG: 4'-phosphopantetheinyl transferase superfamily protein, partial [Candidatus Eisenbacteria bacterium]|nr:4'-phosphopantetheinyl transferase superfamily protein [Candidatus Eisenbacteria bacterium]
MGFDIVSLERFGALKDREGFLAEILTRSERSALPDLPPVSQCAVALATKEAVLKALGCGLSLGWRWHDIELRAGGRVELAGDLQSLAAQEGIAGIRSAGACAHGYAMAWAIIEGDSPSRRKTVSNIGSYEDRLNGFDWKISE